MLHAGEPVEILQHRGGAVTVRTSVGLLARVASVQLDALGLESEPDSIPSDSASDTLEMDNVISRLRCIFDPEIPINVVDLGLIYHVDIQPLPGGGHRVEIAMSMTAPGCGMGEVLREEACMRVESLPDVRAVSVELVWDPPWGMERMTEAARLELGLL
jgi:probable FeS assembly SUF system protein SufT